jgi:hypothetical protein
MQPRAAVRDHAATTPITRESAMAGFDDLPAELKCLIYSFTSPADRVRMKLINKSTKQAAEALPKSLKEMDLWHHARRKLQILSFTLTDLLLENTKVKKKGVGLHFGGEEMRVAIARVLRARSEGSDDQATVDWLFTTVMQRIADRNLAEAVIFAMHHVNMRPSLAAVARCKAARVQKATI